ncbi:unnamed protein product [Strongylus vulgaris]|uniref:Uncharacterized protein n=1 Tax=Strongylus vulgaris TaxID=40348 RepID=A0A3P7L107_STRVU|nr:unnamed protein product [Strongylus vulgaris]
MLLQDELYNRLVDISKVIVREEQESLKRTTLACFFEDYRKTYRIKKKELSSSQEAQEGGNQSDAEQEIYACDDGEADLNLSDEDQKSEAGVSGPSVVPLDGDQKATHGDVTLSNPTLPSASSEPVPKNYPKSKPLTLASTSAVPNDLSHEDSAFCFEFTAEDLLGQTTAYTDSGSALITYQVCGNEELFENKPSTAEGGNHNSIHMESTEEVARIAEVVDNVCNGEASIWSEQTAHLLTYTTINPASTSVKKKKGRKRKLPIDGLEDSSVTSFDSNDICRDVASALGIDANAMISHLFSNNFVQKPALNEAQLQDRLQMFSSLSLRNHMMPFLSRIITYAAKRIYFESEKRLLDDTSDELPGQSVLLIIWWSSNGVIYHAFLRDDENAQSHRVLTWQLFVSQLGEVHRVIKANNMEQPKPILLCDEPHPYISWDVVTKIHDRNFEILPYPANAKDLLPSHYHFFSHFFNYIGNKDYKYFHTLKTDFRNFVSSRAPNFFADGINELALRWDKCIDMNGCYVDL